PAPLPTPTGGGTSAGARTIVRAVIVSQSGPTWTVRTRAGTQTMITITPRTRVGLDGTAAASSRFQPGEDVVILGAVSKGSVTADWIGRCAVPSVGGIGDSLNLRRRTS